MPICKTCRGEYVQEECLCPQCLQPSGRDTKRCHQCGATLNKKGLCPRCKSDVVAWEQESFPLFAFIRRWGALGVIPSLVAIMMWAFYWAPKETSVHHPVVSLTALALSQMTLIFLYLNRYFWREHWWAAQVYSKASLYTSLTIAIAATFVGGVLMAIFSFVLYRTWKSEIVLWQQLFFGFTYASAFVFFTASLTLLAIQDYVDRLDQRVPQPLFASTERLLRVVLEAALKSQNVLEDQRSNKTFVQTDPNRCCEVLEVVRIPENGGIRVALKVYQRTFRPGESPGAREQWVDKLWQIEADRWGRLRSLKPA